jgi:hypothetical protein
MLKSKFGKFAQSLFSRNPQREELVKETSVKIKRTQKCEIPRTTL